MKTNLMTAIAFLTAISLTNAQDMGNAQYEKKATPIMAMVVMATEVTP